MRKRPRLRGEKKYDPCYIVAESLVTLFLQCNCFCNDTENKNKPNEQVDLAKEISEQIAKVPNQFSYPYKWNHSVLKKI